MPGRKRRNRRRPDSQHDGEPPKRRRRRKSSKRAAGVFTHMQEQDCARPADVDECTTLFSDLPPELVGEIISHLGDLGEGKVMLCNAGAVSKVWAEAARSDSHWEREHAKHGAPSKLQARAARIAGGWKALTAAKHAASTEAHPWSAPSGEEVDALLDDIASDARAATGEHDELSVLFLVDGSGSVTEDDFETMTELMRRAARRFLPDGVASTSESPGPLSPPAEGPSPPPPRRDFSRPSVPPPPPATLPVPLKMGILQFSNATRTERPLLTVDTVDEWDTAVDSVERMSGGTNIASPLRAAATMMRQESSAGASRVVVLLTDGRVDSYQAKEAVQRAEAFAELGSAKLFCLGLGRGVDVKELRRLTVAGATRLSPKPTPSKPGSSKAAEIQAAADKEIEACRYLALRTLADPW